MKLNQTVQERDYWNIPDIDIFGDYTTNLEKATKNTGHIYRNEKQFCDNVYNRQQMTPKRRIWGNIILLNLQHTHNLVWLPAFGTQSDIVCQKTEMGKFHNIEK